jgi:hypothetical protein
MTQTRNRSDTIKIDELPDRIEHRRKIAERIARDTVEYAAGDPLRMAHGRGGLQRRCGTGLFSIALWRGPCM